MTETHLPKSPKILLVEDDADVGRLLKRVMEIRLPVQVTWAQNLEDARTALSSQTFDAVITDGDFPKAAPGPGEKAVPEKLGTVLIDEIRSTYSKTVPILFQSARGEYLEEAREKGADECVQKPVGFDPCLRFLEKHLPRAQSHQI